MKAIMMSIKPQHVANILNGIKTLEIRKRFPSDYVGWVYIYVTKGKPYLSSNGLGYYIPKKYEKYMGNWNGKVVARFWCDKVEEHRPFFHWCKELEKATCLTRDDVLDYLDSKDKFVGNPKRQGKVYAIRITKLEIFDKPKELCEFKTPEMAERYKYDLEKAYEDDYEIGTRLAEGIADPKYECANCVELTEWSEGYYGLKRAPQSWCYVEV